MMDEFNYMTAWIASCNIPIELTHWDADTKNLIYNEETEHLTVIDYECANPELFTHDIGRYFAGYLGVPCDFR